VINKQLRTLITRGEVRITNTRAPIADSSAALVKKQSRSLAPIALANEDMNVFVLPPLSYRLSGYPLYRVYQSPVLVYGPRNAQYLRGEWT
jgi:hypothetical protein